VPNAPWVICRWHITEEEIKVAFVTVFNKMVTERAGASCASEEIAANARLVRQTFCDTSELEQEKAALGQESLKGLAKASLAVLVEMTQNCIAENARIAQDQGEYQISSEPQDFPACESLMHSKRYNGLVERYEKAKARFDEVTEAIAQRSAKGERLRREASPFRVLTDFHWYSLWGEGVGITLANLFSLIVGMICTQTYIQAIFSAQDPQTASIGALVAALIVIPVGLPCVTIGMYMHAAHPEVSPLLALPVFLLKYQPLIVGSVAMGGMLLSLISSIAGLSLGIGTMISQDILPHVLPHAKESGTLLRTRIKNH